MGHFGRNFGENFDVQDQVSNIATQGLQLVEKDRGIHFVAIPKTVIEKRANKPPRNQDLPETLRSEAFDGYW